MIKSYRLDTTTLSLIFHKNYRRAKHFQYFMHCDANIEMPFLFINSRPVHVLNFHKKHLTVDRNRGVSHFIHCTLISVILIIQLGTVDFIEIWIRTRFSWLAAGAITGLFMRYLCERTGRSSVWVSLWNYVKIVNCNPNASLRFIQSSKIPSISDVRHPSDSDTHETWNNSFSHDIYSAANNSFLYNLSCYFSLL